MSFCRYRLYDAMTASGGPTVLNFLALPHSIEEISLERLVLMYQLVLFRAVCLVVSLSTTRILFAGSKSSQLHS